MSYSEEVKRIAYAADPECWASYSGKPVAYKRAMELRRAASLLAARKTEEERVPYVRDWGKFNEHVTSGIVTQIERLEAKVEAGQGSQQFEAELALAVAYSNWQRVWAR